MRGLAHPMLLLLDNFEHLISAGADIAELLTLNPNLKMVATSQALLHVYGEHEFPVPPLATPELTSVSTPEFLSRFPAVALFLERAKAVKRDFAVTKETDPPSLGFRPAGVDSLWRSSLPHRASNCFRRRL